MNKLFSVDKKYYYVLFYDGSSDAEKDFVKEFSSSYKNENTPLYKVDMSNKMNSDYYDVNGEENTTPTSLEDIKITRTTLIKIKKGKVVSYVTDKYEIAKTLKPEDE